MGIQTFNSNDPEYVKRVLEEARNAEIDAHIDRATKVAEKGLNPTETVIPGYDPAESLSWDFSPGWADRRRAELRSMRSRRKPLRPIARIPRQGYLEEVYESEVDLEVFEKGLCCAKCGEWKHEDARDHKRQHRKLQDVTGMRPASGVKIKDLCGFCGARLTDQKYK